MHSNLRTLALAGGALLAVTALAAWLGAQPRPQPQPQPVTKAFKMIADDAGLPLCRAAKKAFEAANSGTSIEVVGRDYAKMRTAQFREADVVILAKPLNKAEVLDVINSIGQPPIVNVLACDALAVVLHIANKVPNGELSLEELRKIYSGEIKNWKELGSEIDEAIVPLAPPKEGDSIAQFKEWVMGDKPFGATVQFLPSGGLVASRITAGARGDTGAIGIASLAHCDPESVLLTRLAERKGQYGEPPTADSMKNGKYSLARPLFAYTLGQPMSVVKEWIDWVRSDKGQDALAEKRYFKLRP